MAGSVFGALSLLVAVVAWQYPAATDGKPETTVTQGLTPVLTTPVTPSSSAASLSPSPEPSPSDSPSDSAGDTAPAWAVGDGEVFNSGSPTLEVDDVPSLDEALSADESRITFPEDSEADVILNYYSLGMANGAAVAPWAESTNPTLEKCANLSRSLWQPSLSGDDLGPEKTYCFRSREGRYGYLTLKGLTRYEKGDDEIPKGGLHVVSFSYLLWKMPED